MLFVPVQASCRAHVPCRARRPAAASLLAALLMLATAPALAAEHAPAATAEAAAPGALLDAMVTEALKSNPEIQAALKERQAAEHRIAPAGALDDPMLEAGLLNVPTDSFSLDREDMTMKMIGLSQRLPYSGKRDLRRQLAAKDAESVGQGYRETVNRVLRDLKVAYYDLALAIESQRLTEKNRAALGQTLKVVESRYAVAQATQADVLKAQVQFARMLDELLKLGRERQMAESEIGRLTARHGGFSLASSGLPPAVEVSFAVDKLEQLALQQRPQLVALQILAARGDGALELARKDALPDFDVKFAYGQRDNSPMGTKRSDLVSLTLAMNLPVWRSAKIEPRIAEAQALREKALATLHAQQHEVGNQLHHQITTVEQSLKSLRLYERDVLPVARAGLEAALAAYKVNRVDFLTLLDNQMAVFNYEITSAAALAGYHKALAEVDFLTGKLAVDALGPADSAGEKP
jgi:cobalt-zinc-cadmium efflux system outer membrane protein